MGVATCIFPQEGQAQASVQIMGDSRPEGERNFWNGKQAVTATGGASSTTEPSSRTAVNISEMNELRGEGGSDVFTSTRHVNSTPEASSKAFKMKFWSNDDSPLIRPILDKSVYRAPPTLPASMSAPRIAADGYGGAGCERVTVLSIRANLARYANFGAITVAGLLVFGALVYIKDPNKTNPLAADQHHLKQISKPKPGRSTRS